MANIKSAKKRVRQEKKRYLVNLARKSSIKTVIKKLMVAIDNKDSVDSVKGMMRDAESQLSRAKNKTLHPNTSARKVSRLSKRVAAYEQAAK